MPKLILTISLIAIFLISCGKSEYKIEPKNSITPLKDIGSGSVRSGNNKQTKPENNKTVNYTSETMQDLNSSVSNSPPEQAQPDRKLIKEATLKFSTNDVNKTKETIINSVNKFKGYIANEQENKYPDKINYSINIRVPANKFDELIASISKGIDKFDERNIEVKDVTSEYIDTEARIKTKKEIEIRYLGLLAKAKSVKDMMEIEEALGTIREDIESMEGRFRYMNRQIEYSDIHINFYQEFIQISKSENRFVQGIINGWDNLVWLFIGLVNIWPFIIMILIFIFIVYKITKRGR